jgi:hypothetical protein
MHEPDLAVSAREHGPRRAQAHHTWAQVVQQMLGLFEAGVAKEKARVKAKGGGGAGGRGGKHGGRQRGPKQAAAQEACDSDLE